MNTLNNAHLNGFVKRAAEYGVNYSESLNLYKQAFGEEDGPYRTQRAADALQHEIALKAMQHNKEKHPLHYYLNPFVKGPISEAMTRLARRNAAGESSDGAGVFVPPVFNTIRGGAEARENAREIFKKHIDPQDSDKYFI